MECSPYTFQPKLINCTLFAVLSLINKHHCLFTGMHYANCQCISLFSSFLRWSQSFSQPSLFPKCLHAHNSMCNVFFTAFPFLFSSATLCVMVEVVLFVFFWVMSVMLGKKKYSGTRWAAAILSFSFGRAFSVASFLLEAIWSSTMTRQWHCSATFGTSWHLKLELTWLGERRVETCDREKFVSTVGKTVDRSYKAHGYGCMCTLSVSLTRCRLVACAPYAEIALS